LATSEKHEHLLEEKQVAADSKARLLADAEKYVLHGKIAQAISEYLKIVSIDPNDIPILNTIGDLYLKQNKSAEANKYFSQVAENYVRNNFSVKALAVYKKILLTDPDNIKINSIMASLYAKQGLSVDTRNQYLRVAALLEREGKTNESLDVYEKIVELDPLNSVLQQKLAAYHQAEGAKDKAQAYWAGAARAQVRVGDLNGAANSFEHALELNPLDEDAMRGFLECCQKIGNPGPALEQLKQSTEKAPQNLNMREMLGRAYLESGDPEAAVNVFQAVVLMDESRYENFFLVAQAFLSQDAYDLAISSLDPIITILIFRRETERAAKLYEQILKRRSKYIPALTKLAALYSATGEQTRYLEAMDEIADSLLGEKRTIEALEYLEKILQDNPQSSKHRELHRQTFAEAYPDASYFPPGEPPESPIVTASPVDMFRPEAIAETSDAFSSVPAKSIQEQLQEVDFYIQLGFKDEALEKLNEIANTHPRHPELASRYEKLGETQKVEPEPIILKDSAQPLWDQSPEENAAEDLGDFKLFERVNTPDGSLNDPIEKIPDGEDLNLLWNSIPDEEIEPAPEAIESAPEAIEPAPKAIEPASQHAEPSQNAKPSEPEGTRVTAANDMFADLLNEIGSTNPDQATADFEEHFGLGTAYREMDLIEAAVREYEAAIEAIGMRKGDPRAIQCCGMLSTCFLKRNMPRSALRWCQTGLGLADNSSHEAMALRYDMGVAHSMDGSIDQAIECFDQIFSADPSYRDVAQKIDELRSGFERHAS
jgi:tetratricopeptide (TPR) repeat protein